MSTSNNIPKTITIQTTKGALIILNDEDYLKVSAFSWSILTTHGLSYAISRLNSRTIYMHRLIMDAPRGMEVDHINRNGLDNRRENLRIVTHRKNLANTGLYLNNTTGYRGVIEYKGKWKAQTKINGIHCGIVISESKELAAMVYDEISRQLLSFGSYLNFPDIEPTEQVVALANLAIFRFKKRVTFS